MDICYAMEWAPHRGGPHCRPVGVWAMGTEGDLRVGFLRGYEERAEKAQDTRKRLIASGRIDDPDQVFTDEMLGVPNGLNYCGPITRTDSYISAEECVQAVLGIIEQQWDTKKLRWRSGLKMPLRNYRAL